MKRTCTQIISKKDETIVQLRKKLHLEKCKSRKKEEKIKNLEHLVSDLKYKKLVDEKTAKLINESFSGISLELFKRISEGKNSEYSDTLKSFALTLYFYSACAYNYMRNSLDLSLPHPNTLRSWYNTVDGKPGFTKKSFAVISERVKMSAVPIIATLTFDEMSIRKRVDWDGSQFVGYVDRGCGVESGDCIEAREAFVVMAVGVNVDWKIPIGYFLGNGLSSEAVSYTHLDVYKRQVVGL